MSLFFLELKDSGKKLIPPKEWQCKIELLITQKPCCHPGLRRNQRPEPDQHQDPFQGQTDGTAAVT